MHSRFTAAGPGASSAITFAKSWSARSISINARFLGFTRYHPNASDRRRGRLSPSRPQTSLAALPDHLQQLRKTGLTIITSIQVSSEWGHVIAGDAVLTSAGSTASSIADETLEDAVYDSHALQDFARIDLAAESVPDATTGLKFRRLLETHDLCEGLFAAINVVLAARGMRLREGTMVDATFVGAPSSTKNKEKQRDPQMHQTRKGNQW